MKIPWEKIEPDTLIVLLQEVVSRDGTDYGDVELSVAQKIEQLMERLKSGEAVIYWDVKSESASVISTEEGRRREQQWKEVLRTRTSG